MEFCSLMLGTEQPCEARRYVLVAKDRSVLGAADDTKHQKCYRNSERGEEGVEDDEGLKLD